MTNSTHDLHHGLNHGLRCFERPASITSTEDNWFTQWQAQFQTESMSLPTELLESLGQLMPLLMCGEQSAALVFNREANRSTTRRSSELFSEIEADEGIHDDALQSIYLDLPVSPQEAQIKRRAKRFYLTMGGASAPAEEVFAKIEHLDSCVCSIMHSVANGKIGKNHPYTQVFQRIKQDEARHVGISREHLRMLGSDQNLTLESGRDIRSSLVELIRPEADHWEILGVDWDRLEKKILAP